jgi:hypothetical protein
MRQINQSIPIYLSTPLLEKGALCFTSPKNAVVLLFLDLFRLLWR